MYTNLCLFVYFLLLLFILLDILQRLAYPDKGKALVMPRWKILSILINLIRGDFSDSVPISQLPNTQRENIWTHIIIHSILKLYRRIFRAPARLKRNTPGFKPYKLTTTPRPSSLCLMNICNKNFRL